MLSLGFLRSPHLTALLEDTPRLADLEPAAFDAIVVCGGQAPTNQFRGNEQLQAALRAFYGEELHLDDARDYVARLR